MPDTAIFSYGQRRNCADLSGRLETVTIYLLIHLHVFFIPRAFYPLLPCHCFKHFNVIIEYRKLASNSIIYLAHGVSFLVILYSIFLIFHLFSSLYPNPAVDPARTGTSQKFFSL